MSETSIEWVHGIDDKAGATWNPLAGCSVVSPGCHRCYAMRMAARLEAMGQAKYAGTTRKANGRAIWTGKINLDEKAMEIPLRTKRPTTWFVNSMSDLFHEDVLDTFIGAVFGVMAACPWHTFQILTKRADRLPEWFAWYEANRNQGRFRHPELIEHAAVAAGSDRLFAAANKAAGRHEWPLPNVWLGVSVESQKYADERIPQLIRAPAAVRFLSCEPLLSGVDLREWLFVVRESPYPSRGAGGQMCATGDPADLIRWVIVGGESGPGARPMDLAWARSIVRQCREAGVPAFVKQLGADPVGHYDGDSCILGRGKQPFGNGSWHRLRDGKGGDIEEFPEDLKVRQFPEAVVGP